jgi:hypothetical protein
VRLHELELRALLRSAKVSGLSVERVLSAVLRPHSIQDASTADRSISRQMSTIWQLSSIWLWDKAHPTDIGPLAVLLPVGLYGEITASLYMTS